LEVLVEVRGNLALVDLSLDDHHHLVLVLVRHYPTSFGLERIPGISRYQEGVLHVIRENRNRLHADNYVSLAEPAPKRQPEVSGSRGAYSNSDSVSRAE